MWSHAVLVVFLFACCVDSQSALLTNVYTALLINPELLKIVLSASQM